MDKILLGGTGLEISRLGLGTVKFGRNEDVKYPAQFELPGEKELAELLTLAKDLGINLIDTAPAYGQSEERLGRLLKGQRKDWVIVSKAGEEFENGKSFYDFSPTHIEQSLTRSLKRLQTDYLDVLLIHSDGNDLKILTDDKLLKTLEGFKRSGMVKAIGASTKSADGGLAALKIMDIAMVTYTPDYADEKPALDYAAKHNKGILLKKLLGSGHSTDIEAAMNFAFAHPGTGAAIVGTITPAHLRQNARAAEMALSSLPAASRART